MSWFRVDAKHWRAFRDTHVGAFEWARELAILDLRYLQDEALGPGGDFPSRSKLAAAWGWNKARVSRLLQDVDAWSDPAKRSAWDAWYAENKASSTADASEPTATQQRTDREPIANRSRTDTASFQADNQPSPTQPRTGSEPIATQQRTDGDHTRDRSTLHTHTPPSTESSAAPASAPELPLTTAAKPDPEPEQKPEAKPEPEPPTAPEAEALKACGTYWSFSILPPGSQPSPKTPGVGWTWKRGAGAAVLADIRKRGLDVVVARFRWLALAAEPDGRAEEWLRRPANLRNRADYKTLLWDSNGDAYDGFRAAWEAAGCPSRMPDPLGSRWAPAAPVASLPFGPAAAPSPGAEAWADMLTRPHVAAPFPEFIGWIVRSPAQWNDPQKVKLAADPVEHGRRLKAFIGPGALGMRWEADHRLREPREQIRLDFIARYEATP